MKPQFYRSVLEKYITVYREIRYVGLVSLYAGDLWSGGIVRMTSSKLPTYFMKTLRLISRSSKVISDDWC